MSIEAVNGAKPVGGEAAVAQRATVAAAKADQVDAAAAAAKAAATAPLSPRLRPDFLSGAIVTEFVGNNGQVTLQTPTVAALAYLRAGLDANGQQKADPDAGKTTAAAASSPTPTPTPTLAPAELIA